MIRVTLNTLIDFAFSPRLTILICCLIFRPQLVFNFTLSLLEAVFHEKKKRSVQAKAVCIHPSIVPMRSKPAVTI